jgi:hypothetical protein
MFPFLIPALTALGGVLGGAAKGASEGRQQTSNNQLSQDQIATSQYGINQQALMAALQQAEQGNMNRAGLDLSRRNFSLNAPSTRMNQAVAGSHLANAQDVTVSHPRATIPTITGGKRPSNMTPEARQLGAVIARKSLMDQMAGDTFEDVPQQDWQGGVLKAPGVQALPQASGFEKFAGAAGLVGSGLDAIMKRIQEQTQGKGQPPPPGINTYGTSGYE